MSKTEKYPKIQHLSERNINKFVVGNQVEITEKIDGFQIAFGIENDVLVVRTRGRIIPSIDEADMFRKGYLEIQQRFDSKRLDPNFIYYGEYLAKPHHNTLPYKCTPMDNIALWAIVDKDEDIWVSHDHIVKEAKYLNFGVCDLLYQGEFPGVDEILKLMDRESALVGAKMEGVVIKAFTPNHGMQPFKLVSEQFAEKHGSKVKSPKDKNSPIDKLIAMLNNKNRWKKAIQHLREAGELTETPKDIGPLLAEVKDDILSEEGEFIKDYLYTAFIKKVLAGSVDGFPQWYKHILTHGMGVYEERKNDGSL